jgi:cellobiose phosphorylase
LLNPVHHGTSAGQISTYKVEPYVMAADVYAVPPHTGRGGWTWYTGSAGWMYRLLLETLLGLHLEGDRLRLDPRMPKAWTRFAIHYRYRETPYHISISRSNDALSSSPQLILDGRELSETTIPLVDDRREHSVIMNLR